MIIIHLPINMHTYYKALCREEKTKKPRVSRCSCCFRRRVAQCSASSHISFHDKSLRFTKLASIPVLFSESAKDDIPPDFIYLAGLSISISSALTTTQSITMFSYSSAERELATVVKASDYDKAPERMLLRPYSIKPFKSMAVTGAIMIYRFFTGQQSLTPSRTDKSSHDCDEQIKDGYIQDLEENRALWKPFHGF